MCILDCSWALGRLVSFPFLPKMSFLKGFLAGSFLFGGLSLILTNQMKSDFENYERILSPNQDAVLTGKSIDREESGHYINRNHYNEFVKSISDKLGRF